MTLKGFIIIIIIIIIIICFHFPVPVTSPLLNDCITQMLEKTDLLTSGLIELLQGTILVDLASTVMSVVETSWTSMPEEAMKLVDGVCRSVIAIHMEESCQTLDGLFPTISRVVNAVRQRFTGGGTNSPELIPTPSQPLEGFDQLVSVGTIPTTRGFHDNKSLRQ